MIPSTPAAGSDGALQDVVVSNPGGGSGTLPLGFFVRFADTSGVSGFEPAIERVRRNGITAGCTPGNYCPLSSVTRSQMAVFLLKAKDGGAYVPPPATGVFDDVPQSHPVAPWIEELYHRGITGGCSADPLLYCPNSAVTRAQMAVFLLKTVEGSGYQPPLATGIFGDVNPASGVAPWIEELARRGITGGCGGGNYCPNDAVNRAQMAVFLDRAFNLRNPQETAGTRRDFHYTPEMNLMAVSEYATAASPPIRYEYVWFSGRPVASVDRTTDTTWWAMTDHLGTTLAFTDSAQTVAWRAEHEPYGRGWTLRTADSFQPLRLPGQEAEQLATVAPNGDTDRSYNVFRWYRSGWGRYTEADPLGVHVGPISEGLAHPYLYVSGQPTRLYDDLGLFEMDDSCNPCITRPAGPNAPSANQYSTVYLSVRDACQKQLSQITNVPLRRCIGKSCDRGKVICRDSCPSDQLGGTTDVVGAAILKLFGGAIRSTKLCVNNWDKLTAAGIGNVAIHEWAHGCAWLHGRGGGVPGDSGSF